MSDEHQGEGAPRYRRRMRVAALRQREECCYDEVVFLESARLYRLMKQYPAYRSMLQKLRKAQLDAIPVTIGLESVEGDIIVEVREEGSG
ncbi:MAG: hypothetical protein HGA97_01710 [Chlorobiaceae bacterium]|nr:hypothetical protein [Chlorobiaceae bacterium]